jgi:HK97 family phage major capsid protein
MLFIVKALLILAKHNRKFITTMQQQDQLLAVGTMITTPTGAALTVPVDDDVVVGETVAESGASTADAVTFDAISFVKCPKKGSKILRVPLELLQDAFTTFDTIISPVLARRVARAVAADAIASLISDSDVAVTSAGVGAVTGPEILDLMGALDPSHSQVGGFLMNESTLTSIKKLTANTAGYFQAMVGTDAQGRATIFGKPVFSSPSMDSFGAGRKPICYGNLSRFYFRSVAGSLELQRLDERYAEFGQAGFQTFWRCQGRLAKSASAPLPVRFLANHA